MDNKKIAVFASGAGSNCQKIIEHFKESGRGEVALIYSSKETAGVINVARQHNIPCKVLNKQDFLEKDIYVNKLREENIQLIVLAGFLWKVPSNLIEAFPDRIINLHPALLPKYGGKGMYGMNVHNAVIEAGEAISGITIHYVNENYDEGAIIFQAECEVSSYDTPDTLVTKIHKLEHQHFPRIVESLLNN